MSNELQTKIAQLEKELALVKELAAKCNNQEYRILKSPDDDNFVLMDGHDQYSNNSIVWTDIKGHNGEKFGQLYRSVGGHFRALINKIRIANREISFHNGFIVIGCLTILNQTISDLIEIAARVNDFYIMINGEKVDATKLKEINSKLK